MKSIISVLLALILMISCSTQPENNDNILTSEDTGYLTLAGMGLTVKLDQSETKTATEAPDNYIVTITNSASNEVAFTDSYINIKNLATPIELLAGDYIVEATSTTAIANVEWAAPTYYGKANATVIKKQTVNVENLVCKLSNIRTTVTLQPSLKKLFKADEGKDTDFKVVLTLGEHQASYSLAETRSAFFKAQEQSNTIAIKLSGTYNKAPQGASAEYVPLTWSQKIENVKAGEWRNIYIKAAPLADGSVNFKMEVETWLYDESIDIDIMSKLLFWGEEVFVNPDDKTTHEGSAVLTLGNSHDIKVPFVVNTAIFDAEENCTDIINVIATPSGEATLKSFDAAVDTDNVELKNAIKNRGFMANAIPILPINRLSDYIIVDGNNINATSEGMKVLYNYPGTHKVKMIAVDSQDRRSYTEMTITVEEKPVDLNGPSIVWVGGFNFNSLHELSNATPPTAENFPVVIEITSETGITGFEVEINSAILTEVALNGLSLSANMNLIAPVDTAMEERLTSFGFPIKEQVSGATSLSFDITTFMPMLTELGEGKTDFIFKVTDVKGTQIRTLKLNVVK